MSTTPEKPATPIGDELGISIPAPKIKTLVTTIVGTAPYVQLRFSEKALNQMRDKMQAGPSAKKGKKREARDFDADYLAAFHISEEGWAGIPAASFRNAMISACKIVGFKMTLAKLGIFVLADGTDKIDGMPLVKIEGTPEKVEHHVRNATGVADIRVRAMWRKWKATLHIQYDADMFTPTDIMNLLMRVGLQVGIGEGRPDGKTSYGMGWGLFSVETR